MWDIDSLREEVPVALRHDFRYAAVMPVPARAADGNRPDIHPLLYGERKAQETMPSQRDGWVRRLDAEGRRSDASDLYDLCDAIAGDRTSLVGDASDPYGHIIFRSRHARDRNLLDMRIGVSSTPVIRPLTALAERSYARGLVAEMLPDGFVTGLHGCRAQGLAKGSEAGIHLSEEYASMVLPAFVSNPTGRLATAIYAREIFLHAADWLVQLYNANKRTVGADPAEQIR